MKIGILTYFNDLNFGTNVQALATMQVLTKYYSNASIEIIPLTNFRVKKLPYLSYASIRTLYNDFFRIRNYINFQRNYLKIPNFNIVTDRDKFLDIVRKGSYDSIFIGADTCLEMRGYRHSNVLSPYWLCEDINSKVYVTAASSSDLVYDDLTVQQKTQLSRVTNFYLKIGVRDDATERLFCSIPNIDKNKIERIPDPTFCIQIDECYADSYFSRKKISSNEHLIGIRHKKGDTWMPQFIEEAHNNGYKVVSFRPCPNVDYIWNDIGPLEQGSIYKYFDVMITHLFHEAVFCLKAKKPVLLYPISDKMISKEGESKYSSLLKDFNIFDTCYVENPNLLNAKQLLSRCKESKQVFANTSQIQKILDANSLRYEKFVKSTVEV